MTESAPPKLFEHCCVVFEHMRKQAKPQNILDGGTRRHALVYEGAFTKLFSSLMLPTPYYTKVRGRLMRMGCIRQLARGGGGSKSRWELIKDPDFEDFAAVEERHRASSTRLGMVEANVVRIDTEVATLRNMVQDMMEANG